MSPGNWDLNLQKKDNKRKGQVFNKGYHWNEGKKNDHQSWLQPWPSWCGVQGPGAAPPGLCESTLYSKVFPTLGLCFPLSVLISFHVQFTFWDHSGSGLKGFGGFWWSWSLPTVVTFGHQSVSASWPHSSNCTALCCAYLQETEFFVQERAALTAYSPHLQLYPVFSCLFAQHVLTNSPGFVPQLCSHCCCVTCSH